MISEDWDDWVEEGPTCPGLFDPDTIYDDAEQCWEDAKGRGFDIVKIRKDWRLNDYSYVKLVNYLREKTRASGYTEAHADNLICSVLHADPSAASWNDDTYLQPVLADDPLLCVNTYDPDQASESSFSDSDDMDEKIPLKELSVEDLQARLKNALKDLKSTQSALEDATTLANRLREINISLIEAGEKDSSEETKSLPRVLPGASNTKKQFNSHEKSYFNAYAHFGIHDTMLKDKVRTEGYRDAIIKNSHLFKDKVVMDVGCGTGILSFFAVEAGAKKVIAVDNANIISAAIENAKENGLENKITFVRSKVELVDLPADIDKVDIIISEWMGYCLFFECMLPSVLVARDKFCGKYVGKTQVFPDKARLFLAGWEHPKFYDRTITYWESVYGYKMNTMRAAVVKEPQVTTLPSDANLTTSVITKDVDMNTVEIPELDFVTPFTLKVDPNSEVYTLHGFVAYFDVGFEDECNPTVIIPTGPEDTTTHWEQTVFYLEQPVRLAGGDIITGHFGTKRGIDNHRDLAITLNFEVAGKVKKELHFNLV